MIIDPKTRKKEFVRACKGEIKKKALTTGFLPLDNNILLAKGYLMIVSGFPGSGKSEFVDAVLLNMALLHDWKTLYFSPENHPVEQHMLKLAERICGKPAEQFNDQEKKKAFETICSYCTWYDPDEATVASILKVAKETKANQGLDILVIDPWNAVDHERKQNAMLHENLGYSLTKILKFARDNEVLVIIVPHPGKPTPNKDGNIVMPDLYSISDGAMWRNKADYGVIVHRPDMSKDQMIVSIQKIKQKHMGRLGMILMDYEYATGRFKGVQESDFYLPTDISPPF